MKDMSKHHHQKGFTIIEAMICIFLVSIGLLAVSTMQIKSLQGNSLGTRIIDANLQASAAGDYLLALDFDNTALSNGTSGTVPASSPFSITYSINDIYPYGSSDSYHSILLTTTWSDSFGNHEIQRTVTKLP